MDFRLDLLDTKIEFFEALSLKELENAIAQQIDNNKALMLEPHSISHHVTFHPIREKMLYSAVVHFKIKR
ncbi:YrzA family protein [Paenibacillus endoradicis]|uniref:YrzA family protein n=1 Tax=Paenibacillus endoradicis TaxID=2972487 RepID=UPI002158EA42|nr:YrzA family protein [Paenibacillus endoradicis]MCR8655971.1 YrzA family protein [Paenibacillus endoradicis]MCR8658297.1 YrzA family protein [Paenibacillus endoradicis]